MRLTRPRFRFERGFSILVLASAMVASTDLASAQQCTSCAGAAKLPASQVTVAIADGTSSRFLLTLSGTGYGYDINDGPRDGWSPNAYAPVPPSPFTPRLYSTYAAYLPAVAQGFKWGRVNWILNHKRGLASDIQAAIWSVMDETPAPDLTSEGLAMLADANDHGDGYIPDPGDNAAVVAYAEGSNTFVILEMRVPECGRIGDWVWEDLDYNGIQDPGEPGINNVTLWLDRVTEGNGIRRIASTVTTTKDGQQGYYQFRGLCPGTYIVTVNPASPALTAMTPTRVEAGSVTADSNSSPAYTSAINSTGATDQSIDFGFYVAAQQSPEILLTKTASAPGSVLTGGLPGVQPLKPVTYTYTARNTGTTRLTGISVKDDNGTPDFAGDDFAVGSKEALAPGESVSFTVVSTPPMPHCAVVNNQVMGVGTLIPEYLPSGDVKVTFRQNRAYVDNTYGSNASPSWLSGHTFSQFVGSDKAEFRFADTTGKVVLDFYMDYLTASTRYPSGYGTLGPFGGDGGWITGTQAWVLDYTTTMTSNLNQSPAFYGYTTNSPPEPNPAWDYLDGYTVTVSKNAFGAAGFGSVVIPYIHNSPSKLGKGAISPLPCKDSMVTNTANVVAAAPDGRAIGASATASVVILAPGPAATTTSKDTPPPPPPTTCTAASTIKSDFNGTLIKAGNYVWFNAVLNPGTTPTQDTKVEITNGTIQFTKNLIVYTLPVPDSAIFFSKDATGSKTTFNNDLDRWETTIPIKYSGNTFMAGLAFPMPIDMKDVKDITWTARFTASAKISINWKWAAAVYTNFTTDYDTLGIKSADGTTDAVYKNSRHAGTPEDYLDFVIGGARGGGGSNFTGSYSGTGKLSYTCQ